MLKTPAAGSVQDRPVFRAVDASDKAIVSTIISMANSLNLQAIVKGVDTEKQQQLLFNKGCTHYQGYLFGKPIPITRFEDTCGSALDLENTTN